MRFDGSELESLISRLSSDEIRKAGERGAMAGARLVQQEAYRNFAHLNNKDSKGRKGRLADGRYNGKRLKTVQVKYGRGNKRVGRTSSNGIVFVNILGDYRARFFEFGTRPRHTLGRKVVGMRKVRGRSYRQRSGKGRYTGQITKGLYFNRAIEAKRADAQRLMQEAYIKAIHKQAKR